MASTPPINEQFLREVDEELRRDQALSLWQRWGRTALIAVMVAILAFGGWLYWRATQTAATGVEGEKLTQSLDKLVAGQAKAAKPDLEALAKADSDGVRAAAKLSLAAVAQQGNDSRGAAAQFAAIAADASIPKVYRDLALLRQTAVDFDTVAPTVVVQRLAPLAVPGNPWFGSAGEMVGMAYLKMNKRDEAAKLFAAIAKDKSVPQTIGSRVGQIAQTMNVDASAQTAATIAATAKDSQ